jgi:hypothetical protein
MQSSGSNRRIAASCDASCSSRLPGAFAPLLGDHRTTARAYDTWNKTEERCINISITQAINQMKVDISRKHCFITALQPVVNVQLTVVCTLSTHFDETKSDDTI